jgi:hypothetical protein
MIIKRKKLVGITILESFVISLFWYIGLSGIVALLCLFGLAGILSWAIIQIVEG